MTKYYIQLRSSYGLETVDEFNGIKETRIMLKEYRSSHPDGNYHLSIRPCKAWREKMFKVTMKQLESQCTYLTKVHLADKPDREFIIVSSPSGYRLCYHIKNEGRTIDISSIGVTKTELHFHIRMFESGLEFNK